MTTMKTIAFAAATLAALTTSPCTVARAATSGRQASGVPDRQCGRILHKQIGTQVNAKAATDAAMTYADKQCKGGRLSEGGADYVSRSISAMAKEWFTGMTLPRARRGQVSDAVLLRRSTLVRPPSAGLSPAR